MRNFYASVEPGVIGIELLTDRGKTSVALINASDLEVVSSVTGSWRAIHHRHTSYARCEVWNGRGNRRYVYMHRLLMEPPAGLVVDHFNHDGLDNRRSNLSVVTYGENSLNRRRELRVDNTSGYTGVFLHRASGRWRATAHRRGHTTQIGYFETVDAAAAARAAFLETL